MNPDFARRLYSRLYAYLDAATPLETDCGLLCGAACCEGEERGMLLYPGEEALFARPFGWGRVLSAGFSLGGGQGALFLTCQGACDRRERPLACRMFPLVPYKKPGSGVRVVFDARGADICPLIRGKKELPLSGRFIKRVQNSARVLAKHKSPARFIEAQSELIDDYIALLKKFGKG